MGNLVRKNYKNRRASIPITNIVDAILNFGYLQRFFHDGINFLSFSCNSYLKISDSEI